MNVTPLLRQSFALLLLPLLLSACSGITPNDPHAHHAALSGEGAGRLDGDRRLPMSVAFGPDKRLWRVSVQGKHVLVDVSSDDGATFTAPSVVNSNEQRIKVSAENRPQIAVDASGSVYVVYSAELPQPSSTYFSVSSDVGKHFSAPVLVGDAAAEANTYESNLLLTPDQRVLLFWHDERDRVDWRDNGASIYYAETDKQGMLSKPNPKAAEKVCECCRTAAATDTDGTPVLFARIIYPGNVRDHGLLKRDSGSGGWLARRVSHDEWKVAVCPEQGPTLSIGPDGRYHVAWFSQGDHQHSGLFYAYSRDHGNSFSTPLALGDAQALAGHPSVLSLGSRVALVWQEFDGKERQVKIMQSLDGGEHWSNSKLLVHSASEADYPLLISDGQRLFLQWTTRERGFQMLKID